MRISDWSSDVCSSDLTSPGATATDTPSTACTPPKRWRISSSCRAGGGTGSRAFAVMRLGYRGIWPAARRQPGADGVAADSPTGRRSFVRHALVGQEVELLGLLLRLFQQVVLLHGDTGQAAAPLQQAQIGRAHVCTPV